MARETVPARVRRGGKPTTPKPELAQLTIQVTPGFRLKLKTYIETAKESAGEYLERMARRDLDDRARRIGLAWSAPPVVPFPEPDPDPEPDPEAEAAA